jgi:hypothetical protein
MLEKLERLHGELDRLFAGLKTTAESLSDALEQLSRDVGTFGASVEPEPAPAAPAEPEPAAAEPEPAPASPPSDGERSDDDAGARLVALNMALEGTPRDETARFLADHYELIDVDALLDDVYASAGR